MKNDILLIPPVVSHQYLIAGKNGFLLVDTGLSTNYTHIVNILKAKNISVFDIEMIVITHADGDHFGCLADFQEKTTALVSAASQIEAQAIVKGESSRKMKGNGLRKVLFNLASPLFHSKPAKIDRILSDGDYLPFLGGLEIIDTKGHTPGHISLWSASTRTLFAGDSIIIKKGTLLPSSGPNTWNDEMAIFLFEKQISLKPDRIYAGHGIWSRQ